MSENYVALLGTKGGPAIRTGSANPTSSLLVMNNQKVVVDCGLGVTRGLVDQGVALKELDLIFITHLHSDHYLELGPLIHTAWTAGLNTPLTVFGPLGTEEYWRNFLTSMKDDIELRIKDEGRPDLDNLISFRTIDEGDVLIEHGVKVTAIRNEHPPLVDTFALKFSACDHVVVFSGDTAYLPHLSEFAKDADLLIHEAMLTEALDSLLKRVGNGDDRLMQHWLRSHTKAEDAGKIANDAQVKALVLNHLIPADDPEYGHKHWIDAVKSTFSGSVHIGKDGMRVHF